MKFLVTVERDEEGFFVVECPSLPGCVSQGQTEAEALENIKDAIRGCLEAREALGLATGIEMREVEIQAT